MPSITWNKRTLLQCAKTLRGFGFNIAYNGRSKSTGAKAAAVHRLWNQHAEKLVYSFKKRTVKTPIKVRGEYLRVTSPTDPRQKVIKTSNKDYGFIYVPLKKSELKKLRGTLNPSQFTPGGVWIEKPYKVSLKNFKYKILAEGAIEYRYGKTREVVVSVDPILLAQNPHEAFRRAIKGHGKGLKNVRMLVDGKHGKQERSLKSFYQYAENQLLPDFLDKNEGAEEQFSELFNLILSY